MINDIHSSMMSSMPLAVTTPSLNNIPPTSVFHPSTPQAESIAKLFYFDLAIAVFILAIVVFLLTFILIRFRHKPGDRMPYQQHGNYKLETMWTVAPGFVVIALLVATAVTMHKVHPPQGDRKPDIIVIAHQWWWEYRYPASGVVTANELHMPADTRLLVEVQAADVIHDFWVPDLGPKTDANPGSSNHLWINPHTPGTYLGTCAEYCGGAHALMGIRAIVESREDFDQWTQSQLHVPETPTDPVASRGAQLFAERTCANCHFIAGTDAQARVAPDLTHLADRDTLASGIIENTHSNLMEWVSKPQSIKPSCNMPDMWLTEDEANAIATYLEELK